MTAVRLHDFQALSFDCYGTLIDWESGLERAFLPLQQAAGLADCAELLRDFARHESEIQAEAPAMLYPAVLTEVHRRLARGRALDLPQSAHRAFGDSVSEWPPFADSAAALRYLQCHYRLVILSNVDRASFAGTQARLGVAFDAICTAEDIGSYKPDARNFRYLIERVAALGVPARKILHTAQSLYHDLVPAQAAALASAWIDRAAARGGCQATRLPPVMPRYDFRFATLADFVRAHQAEAAAPG